MINKASYKESEPQWPIVRNHRRNIQSLVEFAAYEFEPCCIMPTQFVQFTILACHEMKLSISTLELALSITSRFVHKRPNSLPLQLLSIMSIRLASLCLETNPPDLVEMHRWSCNSFTNRDFIRAEQQILVELNFNILSKGILHNQVRLLMQTAKLITKELQERIFLDSVQDIQKQFLYYVYVGRITLKGRNKLIAASIIHASLILLSQVTGRFIHTRWICELTSTQETEVHQFSQRLLNQILGPQKMKFFKL